eukprot:3192800-Rhodomonas_salina.1
MACIVLSRCVVLWRSTVYEPMSSGTRGEWDRGRRYGYAGELSPYARATRSPVLALRHAIVLLRIYVLPCTDIRSQSFAVATHCPVTTSDVTYALSGTDVALCYFPTPLQCAVRY